MVVQLFFRELFLREQVTDYAPRSGLLPIGVPHALELLLSYTFVVSAALALLNSAPVLLLDGQAALDALLGLPGVSKEQSLCGA